MSVSLPNGSLFSIGSTYGVAKSVTAVTNADPAVATLEAAHGFIVGDVGRLSSGWSKLNGRVPRVSVVSTNDVTLEGINTTNTTSYPVGTGVGTLQEVTAWQQIIQVLDTSTTGGDQQFTTYSFLEDGLDHQIPTNKNAQSFSLSIADDPSLAQYAVLAAADDDRLARVVKLSLASGGVIYYQGFVTMNQTPKITKNEVMALQVTVSLSSLPVRYAT